MNVTKTEIADVLILEPKVFGDDRGYFYESFNQNTFNNIVGHAIEFVQDNHSKSLKGVLRGLHFQHKPYSQGKLVRCIQGEVFDVAVDIREGSTTFGQWVGVFLSAHNKKQLWIPEGFAHGFLVISEIAEFVYKTTNYYNPDAESSIIWNDPLLNIKWPELDCDFLLSDKDSCANKFVDIQG